MNPTPFHPETDRPPIPFSLRHRELAREMKNAGLPWRPHVGCFVWDPDERIPVPSPFPDRVYFILNLGHFLRFFETAERLRDETVFLPTWHQTMSILWELKADVSGILRNAADGKDGGDMLAALYRAVRDHLNPGTQPNSPQGDSS